MYAQAAIKPNTVLRNGATHIVMRGVQKCTCAGASLRDRNALSLCCIKLDTATDTADGCGGFLRCILVLLTRTKHIVAILECGDGIYGGLKIYTIPFRITVGVRELLA